MNDEDWPDSSDWEAFKKFLEENKDKDPEVAEAYEDILKFEQEMEILFSEDDDLFIAPQLPPAPKDPKWVDDFIAAIEGKSGTVIW